MRSRLTRATLAIAAMLLARGAQAGHCANPCGLADGDLCVSLFDGAGKLLPTQIVPPGSAIVTRVERQVGTCGGLTALAPTQVELTITGDDGKALAITDALRWTPPRAGEYRLTATARDGRGAPDRRVVVAADDRVSVTLQLAPPPGTVEVELTVRRVPRLVDASALPPRAWPLVSLGAAPRSLQLTPGVYQLEWRRGPQVALARATVSGATTLALPVPPAAIAIDVARGRWLLLRVRAADGALLLTCIDGPITLHVAPGALVAEAFAAGPHCLERDPTGTALFHEARTVAAGRLRLDWR